MGKQKRKRDNENLRDLEKKIKALFGRRDKNPTYVPTNG